MTNVRIDKDFMFSNLVCIITPPKNVCIMASSGPNTEISIKNAPNQISVYHIQGFEIPCAAPRGDY